MKGKRKKKKNNGSIKEEVEEEDRTELFSSASSSCLRYQSKYHLSKTAPVKDSLCASNIFMLHIHFSFQQPISCVGRTLKFLN